MKKSVNLFTIFLILMLSLSGCQYGENVICNQAPLYNKGFDMPNLITILNPKDTFNVNDTLWFRIEFPTSFYGDKKSCGYNTDSLKVYPKIPTYFSNKQLEDVFFTFHIIPKIGTFTGAYNFSKVNDSYVAEFGTILSDSTLIAIGVDTTDEFAKKYGMRLNSYEDTGCTYDDDNCAVGKKRHPYELGFHINTSFQGGVKRWKINMRK